MNEKARQRQLEKLPNKGNYTHCRCCIGRYPLFSPFPRRKKCRYSQQERTVNRYCAKAYHYAFTRVDKLRREQCKTKKST